MDHQEPRSRKYKGRIAMVKVAGLKAPPAIVVLAVLGVNSLLMSLLLGWIYTVTKVSKYSPVVSQQVVERSDFSSYNTSENKGNSTILLDEIIFEAANGNTERGSKKSEGYDLDLQIQDESDNILEETLEGGITVEGQKRMPEVVQVPQDQASEASKEEHQKSASSATMWTEHNRQELPLATTSFSVWHVFDRSTVFRYPYMKGGVGVLCGVSFRSLISLSDVSGGVLISRAQVTSVYVEQHSNRVAYHSRIFKTYTMDQILGTQLCYRSLYLLFEDDLQQFQDESDKAKKVKQYLQCAPRTEDNQVVTVVNLLDPHIEKHPWPASAIANCPIYTLFLYLANCVQPPNEHYVRTRANEKNVQELRSEFLDLTNTESLLYRMANTRHCLIPESRSAILEMKSYQSPDEIFRPRSLCRIPEPLVEKLRLMSSISSLEPSLGTSVWMTVRRQYAEMAFEDEEVEVYIEIDGRVGNVIAEYDYTCVNSMKHVDFSSGLYKDYRSVPISKMQAIPFGDRIYIYTVLENGLSGWMEYIELEGKKPPTRDPYNQAPAELVSHYVDRVLGLYRTPIVVERSLVVHSQCKSKILPDGRCSDGSMQLTIPLLRTDHIKTSKNLWAMLNHTRYDRKSREYYIRFIFIGKAKAFIIGGEDSGKSPINQFFLDNSRNLIEFFTHRVNISRMEQTYITRQQLRDISDIFMLDFIIHNPSRQSYKNWARSEARFIATENGMAFWDFGTAVCRRLLQCPPVLCPLKLEERNPCLKVPTKFQLCRFNRRTISMLQRLGPKQPWKQRLGSRIQNLVKEEPWFSWHQDYFGEVKLWDALDRRVEYALTYVDECKQRFGKDIFI